MKCMSKVSRLLLFQASSVCALVASFAFAQADVRVSFAEPVAMNGTRAPAVPPLPGAPAQSLPTAELPTQIAQATPTATPPTPAPDASGPSPICTDRPTKANSYCSVPAGDWQIETDFANFTRFENAGVRTDVLIAPNPYLKLGLDDRSDLEVNWAPWVQIKSTGSSTLSGSGDVYLRYKRRITADGAQTGISLIPFVKIPTAKRGIGNREVEGGIAAPIGISLPNSFTLTFGPEVDAWLDFDGDGYHANLVNLVNLSRPIDKLTLYGELWMDNNFDPSGTINQYSADVAATYLVNPVLQLDVGANFGLNKNTPDYQLYVGISTRF